jgi:hypothetical protein
VTERTGLQLHLQRKHQLAPADPPDDDRRRKRDECARPSVQHGGSGLTPGPNVEEQRLGVLVVENGHHTHQTAETVIALARSGVFFSWHRAR